LESLSKDLNADKLEHSYSNRKEHPGRRKTHENLEESISKCFQEEISSKKTSINVETEYASFEDKTAPNLSVLGMGGSQIMNSLNSVNGISSTSEGNVNTSSHPYGHLE